MVFDGRRCAGALGDGCAGEPGAFDDFEACAITCGAAGECDDGRFRNLLATYRPFAGCDRLYLCTAAAVGPREALCSLAGAWRCGVLGEPPRVYCDDPAHTCLRDDYDESVHRELCMLSLMPSVLGIMCFAAR